MRLRAPVSVVAFILVLLGTVAWADQIVLKDGMVYSGKFIRGDSKIVDFRILGKIESFKVEDIAQIIFREPELEKASVAPAKAAPTTTAPAAAAPTGVPAQVASSTPPSRPELQRAEGTPKGQIVKQQPLPP